MHRIKRWISSIVLCAILLTSAPYALAETRTGKVRKDLDVNTVNVYKAKREEDDQIDDTLDAGTPVKILEDENDGWYYIEYKRDADNEKHKAYILARVVKLDEPGSTATTAPKPTDAPVVTAEPTQEPTEEPTQAPTAEPTQESTPEPTLEPTPEPPAEPTPELPIVDTLQVYGVLPEDAEPIENTEPTTVPEATTNTEPTTVPEATTNTEPTTVPEATANTEPTTVPEATSNTEPTTGVEPTPSTEPESSIAPDVITEPGDESELQQGSLFQPASSITTLTATITTGGNNREAGLYREMNTSSLIKSYLNGDTVTVLERGDPWCRVMASDGNTGYMLLLYLRFDAVPGTNETATVTTGNNAVSVGIFTNKTDAARATTYANGTVGKLIEREATWCKLEMPDLRIGYIKTAFLTLATGNATDVSTIVTGGSTSAGLYRAATDATPFMNYPTGTRVRVLENDGTWSKVDTPDGETGYMKSAFLSGSSGSTETGTVNTGNNTLGVGLFTNKTDTTALATYANGTIVRVLEKEATWCRVEMPDGRVGYIKTAFLTLAGTPLAETAIVRPAVGTAAGLYANAADTTPFASYTTGTVVRVLEKAASVYKVEMPDGNVGYMRITDLNVSTTPVTTATVQTAGGLLAGLFTNTTDAAPSASYASGTTAKVLERGNPWCRVEMPDGRVGYMKTADLNFGGSTPSAYAYVTLPSNTQTLPLYDRESLNGVILGSYFNGQLVTVLNWGANGWAYVQVSGKVGYMQTAYLTISPTPGPTPEEYATVNNANPSHWLNLRLYPNKDAVILGQYYNGTVVRVLERGPIWCHVSVDGLTGYMMTEFLRFSSTPTPPTPVTQYAKVANQNPTHRLNLRAQPNTSSTSLGRYYNGTVVKVLEYNSVWCRVEVDGIVGYMMTQYLSFTTDPGGGGGGTAGYAVVKNPDPREHLNLREGPSKNSTILGKYYNGTSVRILEHGPTWCRVEVNGRYGYMMTQFLSFTGSGGGGGGGGTSTSTATVNSNQRLNLREGPSKSSRSLGQYPHGTRVRVVEYRSDWCRVEVGGIYGYMMTQYLTFDTVITNPKIGIVKNASSNQRLPLYAFMDITSVTLGSYPDGTVMEILSYGTTWCQVRVGGVTGYVMTQYLQLR